MQDRSTNRESTARAPGAETFHDVFLSYAREDAVAANRIYDALLNAGLRPAMDTRDIAPGERDYQERLDALLRYSTKMVFLMSAASAKSKPCRREIQLLESLGMSLVPVRLDNTPLDRFPEAVSSAQYLRLSDPLHWTENLPKLVETARLNLEWESEKPFYLALADRDEMLSGRLALRRADNWLAERPVDTPKPPRAVFELLSRSRKVLDRRRRWGVAQAGLFVLGLCAALWIAVSQRNAAVAQSNLLQVLGTEQLVEEGEIDLALLHLLEASDRLDAIKASDAALIAFETALRSALDRSTRLIPKHDRFVKAQGALWLHNETNGELSRIDANGDFIALGKVEGVLQEVHPLSDSGSALLLFVDTKGLVFVEVGEGLSQEHLERVTLSQTVWTIEESSEGWVAIEHGRWREGGDYEREFRHIVPAHYSKLLRRSQEYQDRTNRGPALNALPVDQMEYPIGAFPEGGSGGDGLTMDWYEKTLRTCSGAEPGTWSYSAVKNFLADPKGPSYPHLDCTWLTPTRLVVASKDFGASVRHKVYLVDFETYPEPLPFPASISSNFLASGEGLSDPSRFFVIVEDAEDNTRATLVTAADRELRYMGSPPVQMASPIEGILSTGPGEVSILLRDGPTPDTQVLIRYRSGAHAQHSLFRAERFLEENRLDEQTGDERPSQRSIYCLSPEMDAPNREETLRALHDSDITWPQSLPPQEPETCLHAPTDADHLAHVSGGRVNILTRGGRIKQTLRPHRWRQHAFLNAQYRAVIIDSHRALGLTWVKDGGWALFDLFTSALPIDDAALSPSGNRLVVASSEDGIAVRFELVSLSASKTWRRLDPVHRWFKVAFPLNDVFIAGEESKPPQYRLPDLSALRAAVREELSPHCAYKHDDPQSSLCWN